MEVNYNFFINLAFDQDATKLKVEKFIASEVNNAESQMRGNF